MISGTADDRLAFVVETEARLDGIKQARAEVMGLKGDTEGMGVASIGATRNMSAWSAIQAEAVGHVGEHSLAIGRLERSLEAFSARAAGVNPVVGMMSASLLKFGIGSIETVGILAGVAAITATFDYLTESSRKTMEVADKLAESYVKLARESALGFGGKQKADIEDINKGMEQHAIWLSALIELRIRLGALGGLVPGIGGHADALGSGATALAAAQQKLINEIGLQNAKDNDAFAKRIKDANDKATVEANRLASVQLRDASKEGTAATGSVVKLLAEQEKSQAQLAAGDLKGSAMHAEMEAKALEFTLRTIDQEVAAKLAANQAEYMRRQVEIAAEDSTEKTKTANYLANERLRAAGAAFIRESAADKVERERQVTEAKLVAAEKRKEQIMLHSIDAYVKSSASLQKILIEAALSPLIKELEGTAVRQFVRAAASGAAGDWAGAAQHAAAGALATAGAREVEQLGASAGGGGGSSGGSYGGGAGSSSSTFQPRGSTDGQGSVTIQLYSQNPYGSEQIQQLQYVLNRAGVLKVPVPISPTNQLKTA